MKLTRNFFLLVFLVVVCSVAAPAQNKPDKQRNNSLLWEISGNGLEKPSYLFGTIHVICKDDAILSDSLKAAIINTERVYFELDLDNFMEMLGALRGMKMRNDTTLADLLNEEEYKKVKSILDARKAILPFSELETYKPLLSATLLMESGMTCGQTVSMEQLIMEEARKHKKRIEGLESMVYQMSIFDSIPYKFQAEQLLKYIAEEGNQSAADKEFEEMMQAYKEQDLDKLADFINNSASDISRFEDLLIHNRNRNWVEKLKTILPLRPITIAVGAGHLPGDKGLINLLRENGFIVKPIKFSFQSLRVI